MVQGRSALPPVGRAEPVEAKTGRGAGVPLVAEVVLQLPAVEGGTRCRAQVYAGGARPVVVLTELPDNPGLPVPAVVARLAEVATRTVLDGVPGDPLWVEAWWGRALASVINDARSATTFMEVDLRRVPPERMPIRRALLESMIGVPLPEPS